MADHGQNARWTFQFQVQYECINSSSPGQNGLLFADNILRCIFLNENIWILIKISLKLLAKGPINNNPALVMAWRRIGDKPLSEPMMVNPLTHICVTRPQSVNGKTIISFLLLHITYLTSYPGYFWEPHWFSMGLLEISRVTFTGIISRSGYPCPIW